MQEQGKDQNFLTETNKSIAKKK